MKMTEMAVAIVALAFVSCHKETVEPVTPVTPQPVAASPPPPVTPPSVTIVSPSSAPPPVATPAAHLAPEGVFYLIAAARVETNDGIIGLPPGTGVKLVRPGIYLTPAGETPLPPEQLTNDMDIARQARDSDRAAQSAVKQQSATEASQARVIDAITNVESNARAKAVLTEIDRQQLNTRLAALNREKQELEAQASALSKEVNKQHSDKATGKIVSYSDSGLATIRAQIATVRDQINATQAALRAAK